MPGLQVTQLESPVRSLGRAVRRGQLMMLGAVLTAVLAACGSSNSSSSKSGGAATPSTAAGAPAKPAATGASKVTIASFKYAPTPITVSKGTTVTFENKDNASHTATADNGSFDSSTITQGSSKKLTFSKAGTFPYHCAFHPFMHGKMVVQ